MTLTEETKNQLLVLLKSIHKMQGRTVNVVFSESQLDDRRTYFSKINFQHPTELNSYLKTLQVYLVSLDLIYLGEVVKSYNNFNKLYLTSKGGEVAIGLKTIDDVLKEKEKEAKKADLDFNNALKESTAFKWNITLTIVGLIISIAALLISFFRN